MQRTCSWSKFFTRDISAIRICLHQRIQYKIQINLKKIYINKSICVNYISIIYHSRYSFILFVRHKRFLSLGVVLIVIRGGLWLKTSFSFCRLCHVLKLNVCIRCAFKVYTLANFLALYDRFFSLFRNSTPFAWFIWNSMSSVSGGVRDSAISLNVSYTYYIGIYKITWV